MTLKARIVEDLQVLHILNICLQPPVMLQSFPRVVTDTDEPEMKTPAHLSHSIFLQTLHDQKVYLGGP